MRYVILLLILTVSSYVYADYSKVTFKAGLEVTNWVEDQDIIGGQFDISKDRKLVMGLSEWGDTKCTVSNDDLLSRDELLTFLESKKIERVWEKYFETLIFKSAVTMQIVDLKSVNIKTKLCQQIPHEDPHHGTEDDPNACEESHFKSERYTLLDPLGYHWKVVCSGPSNSVKEPVKDLDYSVINALGIAFE